MIAARPLLLELRRRLAKPWTWPPQDRQLFLEAVGTACRVEFDLYVVPFARVLAKVNAGRDRRSRADVMLSAESARRATARAYRVLPFTPTCLRESLVVCRMFQRRGVPAELRLGVRKTGAALGAHAWVEDGDGAALTDPLQNFARLSLPGEGTR